MEPTNETQEFPVGKSIKLFLNNGFSYTGRIVKAGKLFILIEDDNKGRKELLNIAISQIQQYKLLGAQQ